MEVNIPFLAILFVFLPNIVRAHGLLFGPGKITAGQPGSVRGIEKLSYQVDDLRSPNIGRKTCRGEKPSGKVTLVSLKNGRSFTVTMAISSAAEHFGDCSVVIMDKSHGNPVEIGSSINKVACIYDGPRNGEGGCEAPVGQVTNDMCLHHWTFTVKNAEKINCKDCVLQWKWTAKHFQPYENFENCAEITLNNHPSSSSNETQSKASFSSSNNQDQAQKADEKVTNKKKLEKENHQNEQNQDKKSSSDLSIGGNDSENDKKGENTTNSDSGMDRKNKETSEASKSKSDNLQNKIIQPKDNVYSGCRHRSHYKKRSHSRKPSFVLRKKARK